ncbi:DUF359 domain-containing protein [Candidatus Thorarchaeota archaeon]|nr:MAG: DUF359 domain-containing protein [Candidatus Thorarchaeota archaeon]
METWALNLFDRLHLGHHVMIDRLVEMPNPVAAVTDGELVGQGLEFQNLIQPLKVRLERLKEYLIKCKLDDIVEVKGITKNEDLLPIEKDATFLMYEGPCCTEIQSGALDIRKKKLGVEDTIEFLKPVRANDGEKIASARIRKGQIDRLGRKLRGTIEPPRILQFEGRSGLKTPKGDVYDVKEGSPEKRVVRRIEEESPKQVIAVGDVTSATILSEGYTPQVMIIDGITKRGPYLKEFNAPEEYLIFNPAAVIYPEAWSTIDTAIHHRTTTLVSVDGEEDLLGFPAVLLAPDDSVVLYGQPDVGIVWIPVTPENKILARNLLEQMPIIEQL